MSKKSKTLKTLSYIGAILTLTLFIFLQYNLYYESKSQTSINDLAFENTLPVLAVYEGENDTISGASLIPLKLTIVNGSGNTFINLNSYTSIDTQISIINSKNSVCTLFELPCDQLDFYYTFNNAGLKLKGPSASTSIAVLTFATINQIDLTKSDFVLTGALSSNGVVGIVGGIKEKAEIAQRKGYSKIYIPLNGLNETEKQELSINVIEVIDIVAILNDAFETSSNRNIYKAEIDKTPFDTQKYKESMKILASKLCKISYDYKNQIEDIENNSQIQNSLEQLNFSKQAEMSEEYYSQGSFCYSSNIGFRTYLNEQSIKSIQDIKIAISNLESDIRTKENNYEFKLYTSQINTLNDLYVYLLLKDRLLESQNFIDNTNDIIKSQLQNQSLNQTPTEYNESFQNAISQLSVAQERFTTVNSWEQLLNQESKSVKITSDKIYEICQIYIAESEILNTLLQEYEIDFFDEQINELSELLEENPYQCIYNGMELKAQMNALVSGLFGDENETIRVINELQSISYDRMQFHSQGEIPLIPYIYYEYSKTLADVGSYQSALQYIHSSLSFAELNILLDSNAGNQDYDEFFKIFEQNVISHEASKRQELQLISLIFLVCFLGFSMIVLRLK